MRPRLSRLPVYIGLVAALITILGFCFPVPEPLAPRVFEYLRRDTQVPTVTVTSTPVPVLEQTPKPTPQWHVDELTDESSGERLHAAYMRSDDAVATVGIYCWPDEGTRGFHVWITWGTEDFMDAQRRVHVDYQFEGDDPIGEVWNEVEESTHVFLFAPDNTEVWFAHGLSRSTKLYFRAVKRGGAYLLAQFDLDTDGQQDSNHPARNMMRACGIID